MLVINWLIGTDWLLLPVTWNYNNDENYHEHDSDDYNDNYDQNDHDEQDDNNDQQD